MDAATPDDAKRLLTTSAADSPAPLDALARLPAPGDNAAVATRTLPAGQPIEHAGLRFELDHIVLEGHRFAARPIEPGEALLSWGLPFGRAVRPIPPGAYVCNPAMLEALRQRPVPFALPAAPNFEDAPAEYQLDAARFQPGVQVPLFAEPRTFLGYPRPGGRGAGTRNDIVLLGTTSRAASFVRALEARLQGAAAEYANVDGIVAVAHTEGDGGEPLNNRDLLLRTLAGFLIHPNVAAVLAVEAGAGGVTNAELKDYLVAAGAPLGAVTHGFLSLSGEFEADLERALSQVRAWLPEANRARREPAPLAHLKLALQCGGSDAFSGVSANPLAGAVARDLLRHGGAANLAETPELMGAEPYVLENVRDFETARAFLRFVEQFRERLAWHGVTGEGNLSGGNRYRGLYNLTLKSLGAAAKRDPAVRLDHAIDYAEPMRGPGFYFMNSPGNDLESIAGQVASGCNLILFTTGNGSITNFPFVPTIKVMSTTARFQLLAREMDVNAGAYLDGTPFEALVRQTFDLAVAIASGTASQGERAGHAQVSIWRNWRQTGPGQVAQVLSAPEPDGCPLRLAADGVVDRQFAVSLRKLGARLASDHVGLILPTSLCAGQVARLAADHFNALGLGREGGLSRFVALVHTEGCGVAGASSGQLYHRTLLNYMAHPLVACGLFLEHGCEKTHNDFMRAQLEQAGGDPARFGWASVQLDGGLDAVLAKIEAWFRHALDGLPAPADQPASLGAVKLGLLSAGPLPPPLAAALARLARTVVAAGGTVVVPQAASLLGSEVFLAGTLSPQGARPSLAYGQIAGQSGFHIMQSPSPHWVETLTGLGASGVEVLVACAGPQPAPGHPLVPMLQIGAEPEARQAGGLDLILADEPSGWAELILQRVVDVLGRRYQPRLSAQGLVDFQLTRGLLGVTV